MADKEKILAALAQLDPLDDDQWTNDGAPKVEVVGKLVGDFGVKRQDIVNAAPDFNREKASASGDDPIDSADEAEDDDPIDQEDVPLNLDPPSREMTPAEFQSWLRTVPKEELEDVEASMKKQRDRIGLEIKYLQDLQKRITITISMTRTRIKEEFPNSTDSHAIRSFIESQTASRAARVERRQTILKGLRPEELDPRAPIDSAYARKTKRGTQRPVRPLVR